MTLLSALRRLFTRDRPDRDLLVQMRDLWNVPPDWTHKPTARVVPTKVRTVAEWIRRYGRRAS